MGEIFSKDNALNLLGIFYLGIGVLAITNSLYLYNLTQVFWMCYISLSIIGIGILMRRSQLVASQLYILAIPLIVWDIDFAYWLMYGQPLWGITDYFFIDRVFTLGKIISLQHLFTVPLGIYVLHLMGGLKYKDGWKISFVQATLVFVMVSLFTPSSENINCVFDPCINVYFGLPYRVTWFILFFGMITITSVAINRLPFLRFREDSFSKA